MRHRIWFLVIALCLTTNSSVTASYCSSFAAGSGREVRFCKYNKYNEFSSYQSSGNSLYGTVNQEKGRLYFLEDGRGIDTNKNINDQNPEKRVVGNRLEDDVTFENRNIIAGNLTVCIIVLLGGILFLWWSGLQLRVANRYRKTIALASIKAARANIRTATAAKRTFQDTRNTSAILLRPYIKLEKPAFRFVRGNGHFYMVLTMAVSNYGSTPAKNFANIETKRLVITTINSDGVEDQHETLNESSKNTNNNHKINAKYIGPGAEAKASVAIRLTIDSGSEEIFQNLVANTPVKWRVHRILFEGVLRFKDDIRVLRHEHYELEFIILSGFGEGTYIRIESEKIVLNGKLQS